MSDFSAFLSRLWPLSRRGLCVVYGNCQAPVLASFLETSEAFTRRFQCIHVPGIHEMTSEQMAALMANLDRISLFIYQPVRRPGFNTDTLMAALSQRCLRIAIPSLFFNSYNPEVAYLRESEATLFYHDRLQLGMIDDYDAFERALVFSEDVYSRAFSERCIEISIGELARRERDNCIDVPMSDFIVDRFREERLFHVLNHPTQGLLRALAARILGVLGLDQQIATAVRDYGLDRWQFPIYRSHYQNAGFSFDNPYCYAWNGQPMTIREFFDNQSRYYATVPERLLRQQKFTLNTPLLRNWDLAAEFQSSDVGAAIQ